MAKAASPTRTTARWRHAPPAQARSRRTTDRFARAAEELLRTRPFEEVTVQDIVRRAGRPIGSFYARFASKEALLPFLYQRYHDGLEPLFRRRLERVAWTSLDFADTVAAVVDVILATYAERLWLLRALALWARQRPESLPADIVERRKRVYEIAVDRLLPHRTHIPHPDPAAAIQFGIFVVSSVAREKLLFAEAPLSRITPLSRRALRDELVRILHSYLTTRAPR
jgi:AcrR family transcriptional regulator